MEHIKVHSALLRRFYFWMGILATLAYRIIIVLADYPGWIKFAWYVGTIGFVIYFAHRYQISERRAKVIHEQNLAQKVAALDGLGADDREAMEYIFKSLESSKEKWNYIAIFVLSGLALLWGIYTDLAAWLG